jgi:phage-related protein
VADDVANLLLRITGEEDDAERSLDNLGQQLSEFDSREAEAEAKVDGDQAQSMLDRLGRELAQFAGKTATAEADVNIGDARAQLQQLSVALQRIDLEKASPEVVAKTAGAMTELAKLQAYINKIDADDINIDVNIKQDLAGRMAGVAGMATRLASSLTKVGEAGGAAGGGAGTARVALGGLSAGLNPVTIAIGAVVAVLAVGLVGALGAVVASAAAAAAAIGALGIAFGGALLAAGVFGAGLVLALKQGGPLARELKTAVSTIGPAFVQAVTPGAQAFLRQLIPAIKGVAPALGALKGPLTAFGTAAGAAVAGLVTRLTGLIPKFGGVIRAAAPLAGPIAAGIGHLAEILLNIARAAMPYLVSGAQKVAAWLGKMAEKTSDMRTMGGVMRSIMGHLKSWLELGKQVARIFFEFFTSSAKNGKGLVDSLAKGAKHLADWIKANPDKIQQFFKDTIPMVKEFVTTLGKLAVAAIVFAQKVGPVLAPVFQALGAALRLLGPAAWLFSQQMKLLALILNTVADAIEMVVNALTGNTLSVALGVVTAAAQPFVAIFNIIKGLLGGLPGAIGAVAGALGTVLGTAFGALKTAATTAWNGIKSAVSTGSSAAVTAAKAVWGAGKTALTTIWGGLKTAASTAWNGVKTAVSTAASAGVTAAKAVWNAGKSALSTIWGGLKGAASTAWNAVKSTVSSLAKGGVDAAKSAWNAGKSALSSIWGGIKSAAGSVWGGVKGVITNAVKGAVNAVKSLAQGAFNAGKAIAQKIADGIKAGIGLVSDAARSVADAAKSVIPFVGSPLSPSWLREGLFAAGAEMPKLIARGVASVDVTGDLGGLTSGVAVATAIPSASPSPIREPAPSPQPVTSGPTTVIHQHNEMLMPDDPRVLEQVARAANEGNVNGRPAPYRKNVKFRG